MMILYGAALSPFVRKVAVVLEEKKLSYDWKMVRPQTKDAEFADISPLGKIPALRDGDFAISDSSVICAYLEKAYPQVPLFPQDVKDYARALWFEEYFDGALIKPMRNIFREGYSNQKFFNKARDDKEYADAEEKLLPMFSYLEKELGEHDWVVANRFSIADIALTVGFGNVHIAGYTLDESRFPRLAAHLKRATSRPSFAHVAKKMDEFAASL